MDALDAIREHAAELPRAKLQEAQRKVATGLADLPKKQSELCRGVEHTSAQAQRRERELMMEHGPEFPADDPELKALRDAETKARSDLRSISQSELKLKELFRCLRGESSKRAMELDGRVRAGCAATWRGLEPELIQDAVEALTPCLIAVAYREGVAPEAVNLELFIRTQLSEDLTKAVKEMAEKQRQEIRAEVCQHDERLG